MGFFMDATFRSYFRIFIILNFIESIQVLIFGSSQKISRENI